MARSTPAPSRTATPEQLAQHARRLAEAADHEASRLARAAPSDMPHAQTFFRSQSQSPGDGSDYLSPPSSLPTVAPVAANAAQDVVPETQALTGGNAAAALIAAVAPGATGGTAGDAAAGLIAADCEVFERHVQGLVQQRSLDLRHIEAVVFHDGCCDGRWAKRTTEKGGRWDSRCSSSCDAEA